MSDDELYLSKRDVLEHRIIKTHQDENMLEVLLQIECDILFTFEVEVLKKMLNIDDKCKFLDSYYIYGNVLYIRVRPSETSNILASRIQTKSARK